MLLNWKNNCNFAIGVHITYLLRQLFNIMISTIILNSLFDGFLILPEILHYAGWSVAVGIIIAVAFVALLFAIVRGFYPKTVFSPGSIVVGIILGILLCLQFIPLCASIALKRQVDNFEIWVNESVIHPEEYSIAMPVSSEEASQIINKAIDEYPIFGTLIGSGEFTGFDTSTIAHAMADELNSFLNRLIAKLLIVALLETAICAFIIVRFQSKKMNRRASTRAELRRSSGPGARRTSHSRPRPRRL